MTLHIFPVRTTIALAPANAAHVRRTYRRLRDAGARRSTARLAVIDLLTIGAAAGATTPVVMW